MQRELAQLRERYCRIFESADKRGEIMLCRLARVEAPERANAPTSGGGRGDRDGWALGGMRVG